MRSHRVREALSCVVRMWFASVWFFSLSRRISGKLGSEGDGVPLFQASGAEESVFCLVACCAVHRAWAGKRKRKEARRMIITSFAGPGWGAPSSSQSSRCFILFLLLSLASSPQRNMSPHLHSSTTTPAKTAHYANALGGALMSGACGEEGPVRAVNGSVVGWGEGVRKWAKHTGGGESRTNEAGRRSPLHRDCRV